MRTSVMVMVLALALPACAALPGGQDRLVSDQDIAQLHVGASQSEVRARLGAPQRVESFSRLGREVWTYQTLDNSVWRRDLCVQFSLTGIVSEVVLVDAGSGA